MTQPTDTLGELREHHELLLKTARRCARDLRHALDAVPPDHPALAMMRERYDHYRVVLDDLADYRARLQVRLQTCERELAIYREHAEQGTPVEQLRMRVARLTAAIFKHHKERGHERCHESDTELYAAAGLEPADGGLFDGGLPPIEEHRLACDQWRAQRYQVPVSGEPCARLAELTQLGPRLELAEGLLRLLCAWFSGQFARVVEAYPARTAMLSRSDVMNVAARYFAAAAGTTAFRDAEFAELRRYLPGPRGDETDA